MAVCMHSTVLVAELKLRVQCFFCEPQRDSMFVTRHIPRLSKCVQCGRDLEGIATCNNCDIMSGVQVDEGLERAQKLLKQSQKRDYYKILGVSR